MISQSIRAVLYFFTIVVVSLYFLESYFINYQFYQTSLKKKSEIIHKNYQNIIRITYQFLEEANYEPEQLDIQLLKTTYPIFKDFIAWDINWIPLDVSEKLKNVPETNVPHFFVWNQNYFALSISLQQFQKPYLTIFLLDKQKFQSKQGSYRETYYPVDFQGKKINPYFVKDRSTLYEKFLPTEIASSNFVSRIVSPEFFAYSFSSFSFYKFLILTEQKGRFIFYTLFILLLFAVIMIDFVTLVLKSFWVKGFVYGEILKDVFDNKKINLKQEHIKKQLQDKKLFEEEFRSFNFGENKLEIEENGNSFNVILPPELISQNYITPSRLEDFLQPRMPDTIEKKRKAIFNPELMSLIQNVTSPISQEQKLEKDNYPSFWKEKEIKFLEFLEKFDSDQKANLEKILDHIYESKISLKSGMEQFFKIILKKKGSEKFCLNLHKKSIGYYYPILFSNIHEYTSKNFIFSINDEFLDFERKDISIIDVDDNLKSDTFFSKKFHSTDFQNTNYIVSFLFFEYYRLFLFFDENIAEEKIKEIKEDLEVGLYPIYPFLHKKNQEQNKLEIKNQHPHNYLLQELNYLRYATQGGKKKIYVSVIQFEENISYEELQNLNLKISMDLEDNEISYSKSYDSICILSKFQPERIIKKYIQPLELNYSVKTDSFPDRSNNYFAYL